jgi:branched-chain amino acid transport system ATP-binding protein
MLLEIKDITASYGKIEVLRRISLAVSENEIIGIIGANGAGKSTLLKVISGLVPQINGEVLWKGRTIKGLNPTEIVKMGISQVPEGRQLFPKMTVLENIELGAYLRKNRNEIKKDIREWIYTLFPILRDRENQVAGTLSGGEQQMLAIARGLMSRPQLFMLDEPSLGLAPLVTETVFSTIKKIAEDGLATILVEQNSAMALDISNRTYVFETGQIAIEGLSRDLVDNPHVKKAYLGL